MPNNLILQLKQFKNNSKKIDVEMKLNPSIILHCEADNKNYKLLLFKLLVY